MVKEQSKMTLSLPEAPDIHGSSLMLLVATLGLALWLGLIGGILPPEVHGQTPSAAPSGETVTVALLVDDGPVADSLERHFREEVGSLFSGRRPVQVEPVNASTTMGQGQAALLQTADAVVAIGPVSSRRLCTADSSTAANRIAVPTGSGLFAPEASGAEHRCTIAGPSRWASDHLQAFQTVTSFDDLKIVVDARVADAFDPLPRQVLRAQETPSVEVTVVPVSLDSQNVSAIADDLAGSDEAGSTPAVYLDHVDRWSSGEVQTLTRALADRSIPVFAHNPAYVRRHGALAAPDVTEQIRARQAALAVETLVTGGPAPVEMEQTERSVSRQDRARASVSSAGAPLIVNRAVADAQQIPLPWSLQVEAQFIDHIPWEATDPASRDTPEPLSLAQSMRVSIRSNLELQAKRQTTDAQANRVDVARSRLLPQVNVSATGRTVSEDVASASLGSQPEREVTSALSFRQVIFNEPAFAELSVERRMQAMREFERRSTRLDAAQDAADAYVGVLQARAAVKIQRENVRVVRTNLEAARSRRAAGEAGPQEVSRLQTQVARAEQGLLEALGRERAAEIQYNRVLDRPLAAPVELDRETGVDPRPVLRQFPYTDFFAEVQQTSSFRRFWVKEAHTQAPEVQAVERLVSARERQVTSANRSFWMPTLALEGALSGRVAEGGSGTSGVDLPLSGSGSGGSTLPTPPDEQWSLSLTASFPLFNGTERAARKRQASDQLKATRTRRAIAETGVEQRVRTALVNLETSYEAVQRALRASDAAQRTLDVVEAAYQEGTATLVDLIDAQSAALATRQEASNAAYGLIRDWTAVQRAAGSFRVLRTAEEQRDFNERLRSFLPPRALEE